MGPARFPLVRLKSIASTSARVFSSSADPMRRRWNHLEEASEDSDGESNVYTRALKIQRPSTVRYRECLRNFVSLIGEIERPLKACEYEKFIVHTVLKVKAPTGAYSHFSNRIMLKFWDEMAELSVQHLKMHHLVYVSGRLGSYVRADEDGKLIQNHEVRWLTISFLENVSLIWSWTLMVLNAN